jgi:hypothetical protein
MALQSWDKEDNNSEKILVLVNPNWYSPTGQTDTSIVSITTPDPNDPSTYTDPYTTSGSSTSGNVLGEMLNLRDEMVALSNNLKDIISSLGMTLNKDELTGKENLVVESDMNILGDVTLANLSVSGNIQAGTITIDTLDNSVNVLGASCYNAEMDTTNTELCDSQTLYIQKSGSGNLNIFDGKMVFSPNGSVIVEGPITTEKLIIDTSLPISASAGQIIIPAGQTVIEVNTTAITDKSMIYVTPERPVSIGSKVISTGKFEIILKQAETEDLPVNWMIVDKTD